jgi:hypothetical protein
MASFKYYNNNPYRIEEEDCVTRAISEALQIRYDVAKDLLRMSAERNNCDALCVCCYHYLLEDVFNLPVYKAENWERVKDIADEYPNSTIIIRVDSHLTVCKGNVILDLWDCRERLVDCFWVVDK